MAGEKFTTSANGKVLFRKWRCSDDGSYSPSWHSGAYA